MVGARAAPWRVAARLATRVRVCRKPASSGEFAIARRSGVRFGLGAGSGAAIGARRPSASRGRARRPKPTKLSLLPRLLAEVEAGLERCWSPQQISARRSSSIPMMREMRISHETIYRSLFVQSRGELRRQLSANLRSGRGTRRAQAARTIAADRSRWSRSPSARPRSRTARVPGHWEGDLLIGAGGQLGDRDAGRAPDGVGCHRHDPTSFADERQRASSAAGHRDAHGARRAPTTAHSLPSMRQFAPRSAASASGRRRQRADHPRHRSTATAITAPRGGAASYCGYFATSAASAASCSTPSTSTVAAPSTRTHHSSSQSSS